MTVLILGLVLFLGVHSVSIAAPGWRDAQVRRLGELPWKGLYAAVALVGFVLIVWGYGQARLSPVVLYGPPSWGRHLAMLLMLPVFVLLVAGHSPGRIRSTLKHPMLVAVKLWAVAHLLANGTLADVVLFGALLAWAVVDRISVKHRPGSTPAPAPFGRGDIIALVVGLVLYAAFVFWLHGWWIGIPLA